MSHRTDTVTVRLLREQVEALKSLPEGETASSLVRSLITLYMRGLIPKAWVFAHYHPPKKKTVA